MKKFTQSMIDNKYETLGLAKESAYIELMNKISRQL